MHNTMVVKVRNRGQSRPNKVRRISLVVGALAADAVEKFAAQCKICNKVYYSPDSQSLSLGWEEWSSAVG